MRDAQAEHIKRRSRTFIRYSSRTERALAAMYGTSVANIRAIRRSAQPNHVARMPYVPGIDPNKISIGTFRKSVIPAVSLPPVPKIGHEQEDENPRHDLEHLRVEGGEELPLPLR